MTTYVDSSVIVAFYLQEPHSRKARRALAAEVSAPLTPLLDLEVRTVFRRMVGSKRMTPRESAAVLSHFDDDIAAGRLAHVPCDLYAMFSTAETLSARHAQRLLSRSLDTLHVAAALDLGCTRFITLDSRQGRLAAACGLEVVDLTKPRPRRR